MARLFLAGARAARPRGRRSPRFVVRVLAASFVSLAAVLVTIGAVLVAQTRAVVERGATANLQAAHRQLATTQKLRHQDAVLRASLLVALDDELEGVLLSYQDGRAFGADAAVTRAQLAVLERHIRPAAQHLHADVIAIAGWDGLVVAATGPRAGDWPAGLRVLEPDVLGTATEAVVATGGRHFWATVAPIALDGLRLGHLVEAHVIDRGFVRELAADTRSDVSVLVGGRVVASTAADAVAQAIGAALAAAGDRLACRLLRQVGPGAAYATASIDAGRDAITAGALPTLGIIAAGGLFLCALVGTWLAERVAGPIDRVTRDIAAMIDAGTAMPVAVPTPAIHELETLTNAFNGLLQSVHDARGETDAACLGAIGALAAALDARDPYTAGHSERVSRLSVEVGHVMGLSQPELEILRFGALLHDIGKIGISDVILQKSSPLSEEEYATIKSHTILGAQILDPVRFLQPHIPIVELHHERPDGGGYPYGLHGDDIPVAARIVHVVDAFDAMTTARAYRAALPYDTAMTELWRHAGTDFDVAVLEALARVVGDVAARQAS